MRSTSIATTGFTRRPLVLDNSRSAHRVQFKVVRDGDRSAEHLQLPTTVAALESCYVVTFDPSVDVTAAGRRVLSTDVAALTCR